MEEEELLFKFYDPNIKEEKDPKKIKDDQIFAKSSLTQKIIKFNGSKLKNLKDTNIILETDTAVFVGSHN
jgi:hypothetical protein